MPAPIYLQNYRNPFIPLLGQMMLMRMGANIREKEATIAEKQQLQKEGYTTAPPSQQVDPSGARKAKSQPSIKTRGGQTMYTPELKTGTIDIGGQQYGLVQRGNKYQILSPQKPDKGFAPKLGVIFNTKDPTKQKPYTFGDEIPDGWQVKSFGAQMITNINPNTPAIKTKLQNKILSATDMLANMTKMEKMAKPEFFNLVGKTVAGASRFVERVTGKPISPQKQAEYFAFEKFSKQNTLKERKDFTGVAGGEKEMTYIERTTPDVKRDSYTAFMATIKLRKELLRANAARAQLFLSKGVDLEKLTHEDRANLLAGHPLDNYGFNPAKIDELDKLRKNEAGGVDYDFEYIPGRGMVPAR